MAQAMQHGLRLTGRARSATLAARIREDQGLATKKKAVSKKPSARKPAAKKAGIRKPADKPVGKSGLSAQRLGRLAAAMQAYADRGEVAGVVTLVHRHGETAHVGVHGWQDKDARVAMRRDSLFRIASMTKPVVSVA